MVGKELVVVGTCITHLEVHYFSVHTTPTMSVRDAVRISMRYDCITFLCYPAHL